MKKKIYDVGTYIYMREQKRGLETAAIIGISMAASSAAVGITSAASQKAAVDEANDTNVQLAYESMLQQEKLFNEANRFNSGEAQKARDFNSNEARISRQYQTEMLDKTMDWYEKYNSPSAQVQRYLNAGLNPSSLAGNLGTTPTFNVPSSSAVSGPAASASSAPSVPMAHVDPSALDLSNVLNNALSDVSSFFDIKKTKAETEGITTDTDIKKASKDLDLSLKRGALNKIRADINFINADIDKTNSEIDQIGATIMNLNQNTKLLNVETAGKELDNFFHSQEYEKVLNKMEQDYKISRQLADAQIKLYASEAFKNKNEALAASAQALFYKASSTLTEFQGKYLDAYKELLNQEAGVARTKNYLDTLFGLKERQQGYDIGKEQYERARYENTTLFRMIQAGQGVTNSVGHAMVTYKGLGAITR